MDLRFLFEPRSVAIIGASTQPGNVGNDVVKNLATQGFSGAIYPVNPKATELYGLPCYASIADVPSDEVDLAVIVIPAAHVPDVLEEAVSIKKVKAAIVISAGFKEIGNTDLELRLREVAERHEVALVGPNCLGVLNPSIRMNASFAATMPAAGPVAFLSQSGALCTAVLDYATGLGVGFSRFVSIGNKALLDEEGFLEYFATDEATKVIAMYSEDLKDPGKILETARRITHGPNAKPIVILKSGKSQAGAGASASHTGSLAGSDASYEALFRQSGIVRAENVAELFDFIQAFTGNGLPTGRRVAIVTNAGGPGVLATDAVVNRGLELAKLSPETEAKLKASLPAAANTHNPVDVLGDAKADRYEAAIGALASDPNVDSLLVLLTPQSMTEVDATAEAVIAFKRSSTKPVAASFMGHDLVESGMQRMAQAGVPVFRFPEEGADSLAVLSDFAEKSRQPIAEPFRIDDVDTEAARRILDDARGRGLKQLSESEAVPVFAAYGFRTLRSYIAKTSDEVAQYAQEFSSPFVMKIVSPDILHKSDVGGVHVGVATDEVSAREAYESMMRVVSERAPEAQIEGVLLVEMAPKGGAEIVLGSTKDPVFGNLAMVGLGGILVEVLKDVSFGLVPLGREDAQDMIDRLRGRKILDGVRGGAALDVHALLDSLGRLSQLLTDFPEIQELDINPLLVLPEGQGTVLLDARIVLGE